MNWRFQSDARKADGTMSRSIVRRVTHEPVGDLLRARPTAREVAAAVWRGLSRY
jgi:hypothetical protein